MSDEIGRYVGPTTIACTNECEVPGGVEMVETPRPRHAWGDMVHCPHSEDGCERSFLVVQNANAQ